MISKLKKEISFERNRKKLLRQMISDADEPVIEKVIRSRNDDVPKFLKALDKFESKSRKQKLMVK